MPVRSLLDRAAGTILLSGKEVRFTHPSQAVEAGIAMVTEDRKRVGIFSQMTFARTSRFAP